MEKEASLILEELKRSVHGKDKRLKKVLMSMLAQGHILLDDVPGVGKKRWPYLLVMMIS